MIETNISLWVNTITSMCYC